MAWSIFTQGGGPSVALGWATQFLQRLGAPVTPGNLEFVYQWEKSEGGGGKFNPLNQGPVAGKPWLTTTGQQYGGGAADFASWDAGLEGAYDFLHYNYYKGVLQGLMANDPVAARTALWQSPWAASHYGYGSNWANVPIPGGTATVLPTGPGGGSLDIAGGLKKGIDDGSNPACAWTLTAPSVGTPKKLGSIPLPSLTLGGGQLCLLTKEQVRAGVGMLILGTAVVVGLVGAVVLVAYGLKAAGVEKKANALLGIMPAGKAVKTGATKTAKTAPVATTEIPGGTT